MRAQSIIIQGKVVDARHQLIAGATVLLQKTNKAIFSDNEGAFSIKMQQPSDTLIVSHIGYLPKAVYVDGNTEMLVITLLQDTENLDEVTVSTGYQVLPKERATGSFVAINNSLINRSISTDILSRLENVSSGLLFDRRFNGKPSISVRGLSTIQSETNPLIIVDNFPYEGDINNINPNDVESITILRDAAAASIWGARAGNGVIVITTKKGKLDQPVTVELNSNITIGEKPDLFYNKQFLSSDEYIGVEQYLFNKGYYDGKITDPSHPPLSPVVQALFKQKEGLMTVDAFNSLIAQNKKQDVRNDLQKYFLQNSLLQQYSLSLRGGGNKTSYFMSGSFDRNKDVLVRNGMDRATLNSMMHYYPLKPLELTTNISYSQLTEQYNNTGIAQVNSGGGKSIYPYARLADDNVAPLSIVRDYSDIFIKQALESGLQDWSYRPLQDLSNADYRVKQQHFRMNTALKLNITSYLNLEGRYQYELQNTNTCNLQSESLYYTRNLINQYAYKETGTAWNFPIPKGAILDNQYQHLNVHSVRGQANFNKRWNQLHNLALLAGIEVRQAELNGSSSRLYGYNQDQLTNSPVDFTKSYVINPYGYTAVIPNGINLVSATDRNLSYYGNASYSFKNRYTLSASARKDVSNLFGVHTNQKGVPLWSAGAAWDVNKEGFYHWSEILPYLKLRMTYGYSGNVNKSLTAFTTGGYYTNFVTQLPYIQILTPPNPKLRWEKIQMLNWGVDFESKNKILSGSIEYYLKKGIDLIGEAPLDPTVGFNVGGRTNFTGNNAALKGQGVDVQLNLLKQLNKITYSAYFLYSYNKDRITKYDYEYIPSSYFSQVAPPLPGHSRYGIYSLKWAGLNPQNGNPRILMNGAATEDYSTILSGLKQNDILYNGPALPVHFGSLRQNIQWRGFTIGFNISYKMGYYFRAPSISYTALFENWQGHDDYRYRWQKAGDELHTNVPSLPEPGFSPVRDFVYTFSDALIAKGDHIRFQDINVGYDFSKERYRWLPFQKASIYGYINNIGILWQANNYGIDPDFVFMPYPPSRTYAIGLRVQL